MKTLRSLSHANIPHSSQKEFTQCARILSESHKNPPLLFTHSIPFSRTKERNARILRAYRVYICIRLQKIRLHSPFSGLIKKRIIYNTAEVSNISLVSAIDSFGSLSTTCMRELISIPVYLTQVCIHIYTYGWKYSSHIVNHALIRRFLNIYIYGIYTHVYVFIPMKKTDLLMHPDTFLRRRRIESTLRDTRRL